MSARITFQWSALPRKVVPPVDEDRRIEVRDETHDMSVLERRTVTLKSRGIPARLTLAGAVEPSQPAKRGFACHSILNSKAYVFTAHPKR